MTLLSEWGKSEYKEKYLICISIVNSIKCLVYMNHIKYNFSYKK